MTLDNSRKMSYAAEACLIAQLDGSFHWLVVRTKPRQEKIAMAHLRQRQVRPYCPMFKVPPWHKRAPRGPVPLFAGYIFVYCNPYDRLNAVNYCPGVLRTVSFDGRLATVEQEFVDALRLKEAEEGCILSVEEQRRIPVGSHVTLMDGPLKGVNGVFKGYMRSGQRAQVLMEFLRTQRTIEVDAIALAVVT